MTLLVVATGHLAWWVGVIVVVAAVVIERELLSMRRIGVDDADADDKQSKEPGAEPSTLPRATRRGRRRRRRGMVAP